MRKILIFSCICIIGGLISCNEDTPHESEAQYSITIHSPDTNAKHVGDQIHIHVDFDEANNGIVHHINVSIKSKIDGSIIYNSPAEPHIHEMSGHYEHHDNFVLNVIEHTDWILEARVWGHSEGIAEAIKSIEFHVHP